MSILSIIFLNCDLSNLSNMGASSSVSGRIPVLMESNLPNSCKITNLFFKKRKLFLLC